MPSQVYECLLILDSNRYARDQAGVSGQLAEFVTKHGGEMLASRLWEERRLAYPINGQRKGTYWLTYFKLDSRKLTDVKGDVRLSESILRALFLKVDPRIAETLVSHALSGGVRKEAPATEREQERDGEGGARRRGAVEATA
ncbi:MAG: 30S ribosomal protein S6 [Pirellulales bacterium]|nr:30S ribosomal protein S6 [Pirellulales bacterium]